MSSLVSGTPDSPDSTTAADFPTRCDIIEGAYEFFLGYAARGLPPDHGSATAEQVRAYLNRCHAALAGIGHVIVESAERASLDPLSFRAFADVVDRDARDASAAISLVLAQPTIGSQAIDNLNASIHIRAVLTDLFLVDELLKAHR